jgi:GNAT superfamily N-acetyltransferase
MPAPKIIDVTESNVDKVGFFCAMSKPEQRGYQDKRAWLKDRFPEGLRLKIIASVGRAFIEYIPGEFAWRAIEAQHYMVIHCLWVVGRSKAKGCASALLDTCISEARSKKMLGVAAVTARRRLGFVDTDFFLHKGFRRVETAPPGLDLVAMNFRAGPDPKFLSGSDQKLAALGQGLTIVTSPQCPYTREGAEQIINLAQTMNISARSVRLERLNDVLTLAPSGYASFDIACAGKVVGNLFHCMTAKRVRRILGDDLSGLQPNSGG